MFPIFRLKLHIINIKSSRPYSLVDTLLEEGSVPEFQLFLQKTTFTDSCPFKRQLYRRTRLYNIIRDIWRIYTKKSLRILISLLFFFPLHVFLQISATMIGMKFYARAIAGTHSFLVLFILFFQLCLMMPVLLNMRIMSWYPDFRFKILSFPWNVRIPW